MSPPLRILMLIEAYPPEYTGAGKQLQTLAGALVERGISVQVLTSHDADKDTHEAGDVPVTRLACPGPRRVATFARRTFVWMCRHRRDWDLVHIHGVTRSAYGGICCASLLRKPSLLKFTLLGSDDAATIRAARMGRLKLRVLGMASAFIAPSQALARAAEESGVAPALVHSIPNGVDRNRFRPLSAEERLHARHEWMAPQGWIKDDLLVVFLGAIEPRKGVDVLLAAWPQVVEQCPRARLIIAGPETLWSAGGLLPLFPRELAPGLAGNRPGHIESLDEWVRVREQARWAKAEASLRTPKQDVEFVGPITNPESLLAAADIFCLPSRAEGLPNAALEAMSCGTACVLSRLEGVTTGLLPEHDTEALVPPGDADALGKALVRMLQEDALREAIGDEGMKAAVEYEMEDIAARYVTLYRHLLHSQIEE